MMFTTNIKAGSRQVFWLLVILMSGLILLFATNRPPIRILPKPFVESAPLTQIETRNQVYDISRRIRYSFTLENPTNTVMRDIQFFTHAPVTGGANQHCCSQMSVSHPYDIQRDEWGNQTLRVTLEVLPPYSTRIISINALPSMASVPNLVAEPNLQRYLADEALAPLTHPDIERLANELHRASPEETMRAIYDWLVANIAYGGYDRVDRGAVNALQTRQGDCTEFMYLMMALARVNAIPIRGIAGYVYNADAVLKPEDHHNWAEFYMDGTWHVADAQKKVFMQGTANFIALRVLAPSPEEAVSNAHRFWYDKPALRARMN